MRGPTTGLVLFVVKLREPTMQSTFQSNASFNAMPPLEALKILLSLMVTLKVSKRNRKLLKVRLIDISRAHFYGQAQREVFVTLPEGDQEEGKVGLLLKSVYGTCDAANIWQQPYTDVLNRAGFKRSAAWPAIHLLSREVGGTAVSPRWRLCHPGRRRSAAACRKGIKRRVRSPCRRKCRC